MPSDNPKRPADGQAQPPAKRMRTDTRLFLRKKLSDLSRLKAENIMDICPDISANQYEYLQATAVFQTFQPRYSSLQARFLEITKSELARCAQWIQQSGSLGSKKALNLSRHMLGCLIRTMGDVREAATKANNHETAQKASMLEACALAKLFSGTEGSPDFLANVPDAVERFDAVLIYLETHDKPWYTSVSTQTDDEQTVLLDPVSVLSHTSTTFSTEHSADSHLSEHVKSFEVHPSPQTPSWDDIHGLDGLKVELATKIFASRNAANFRGVRRQHLVTVLLHGPNGTGKTSFVQSFAKHYDLPMFQVSGAIKGSLQGQTEKSFELLAKEVQSRQPCILFFDEAEALLRSSESDDSRSTALLSTVKQLWDSVTRSAGDVFVFGATNKPWDIVNRGFRRRFRHLVLVGLPDELTRGRIFQSLLPPTSTINADQIKDLASLSEGYSVSDIGDALSQLTEDLVRECMEAKAWRKVRSGSDIWLMPATASENEPPIPFDKLSTDDKRRMRPRPVTFTGLRVYFDAQSSKVLRKTVKDSDIKAHIEWQKNEEVS